MAIQKKTNESLSEYRKQLIEASQKSQEDFDKTVLLLSTGALGISFAFVKDILGSQPITSANLLIAAWAAWALSAFAVLSSYFLSHKALRKAISQVDEKTIRAEIPGGCFAHATEVLNILGALLFLIGLCCMIVFSSDNLSTKGATMSDKKPPIQLSLIHI